MAPLKVEYRRIGLLPTCIGNERIRIADDGRVSHSRNTVECAAGAQWSDTWRAVGQLDPDALSRLAQQIIDSGVLALEAQSIDPTAEGGKREEMDLTVDQREYHFTVENTDPPAFRTVVRLLWGVMSTMPPGPYRG